MLGIGTKQKEIRRLRHRLLSLEEMHSERAGQANVALERPSPALPVAYYMDRDTLSQIANGKGIYPASIRVEVGQTASTSSATSSGLGAKALGLTAELSQATESSETKDRRLVFERGPNLTHLVDSILSALMAEGQLRRDLLSPPPAAKEEMRLLRALQPFPDRWNIELVPDVESRDNVDTNSDQETEDQTADRVKTAVDILAAFAYLTAQQEKSKEYEGLKKNGELALVETTWTVVEDSARGLCLHPVPAVSAGWLPADIRNLLMPLHVAVDRGALTDQGRARFVPGSRVWASVFGTAFFEGPQKDSHVEARVAPIAIVGDLASA